VRIPATSRAASTEVERSVDESKGVGSYRIWSEQEGMDDDGGRNAIEEILCQMLVSAMQEVEIRLRVEERR